MSELNEIWTAPTSLHRLHQLALTVSHQKGRSVLNTLDYLAEIREDAERLIAVYVAEARKQGETWQAIAANLGTTKQAAQQRYGD